MKTIFIFCFLLFFSSFSFAQTKKSNENSPSNNLNVEKDLQYTLDNLKRTRDILITETENLSPAQWSFKESPERWSIGEVVEHLAIWELLWAREISIGLRNKPTPELNLTSHPDSYYHTFIMEEKNHDSPAISKPQGHIVGKDNLNWFVKLRNENINFAEKIQVPLKDHFEFTNTAEPRNMYQVYIYQWGHIDRHLKQIKKIKVHPKFPN